MYKKLKSCVRTDRGLTDLFNCTVGVRQGCMVSPLRFSFFINELVTEMPDCNGIFLSEEAPNVCSLLFADDVANVADTAGRLQSQINILAQFCDKWGLSLNINKSQIVVFRNGGYLRHLKELQ